MVKWTRSLTLHIIDDRLLMRERTMAQVDDVKATSVSVSVCLSVCLCSNLSHEQLLLRKWMDRVIVSHVSTLRFLELLNK